MLLCHACCALSFLCCNEFSLLSNSYRSRIGRVENPLYSVCGRPTQDTSHLILHSPTSHSLQPSLLVTLCLSTTSGLRPGELPSFYGFMVFRHAPIPRKGSESNSNNNIRIASQSKATFMSSWLNLLVGFAPIKSKASEYSRFHLFIASLKKNLHLRQFAAIILEMF